MLFFYFSIYLVADYGHDGQSQWRPANYTGDILKHKCVRKHTCTLCSLILILRWMTIQQNRAELGRWTDDFNSSQSHD